MRAETFLGFIFKVNTRSQIFLIFLELGFG